MFRTLATALATAIVMATATGAAQAQRAADGITNVSQDSALAGGVTNGDSAGFPITISTSGTYRLTSNLVVPAGADAIVVNPMLNVVIDLNGYQIVGVSTCSASVICGISGPIQVGVRSQSSTTSLTVRNGRMRGFGGGAVLANTGTVTVEDLQLWNNAAGVVASRVMAYRVMVIGNTWLGIGANTGVVRESVFESNQVGIQFSTGRITDTLVTGNTMYGVQANSVQLQGNTFSQNGVAVHGTVNTTANIGL